MTKNMPTWFLYTCMVLSSIGEIRDVKATSLLGTQDSLINVNLGHQNQNPSYHAVSAQHDDSQNAQQFAIKSTHPVVNDNLQFVSFSNQEPLNKGNLFLVTNNGHPVILESSMLPSTNEQVILVNDNTKSEPLVLATLGSNNNVLTLQDVLDNQSLGTNENLVLIKARNE